MVRRCFREPIPEFALAADLLADAADALLLGDMELCANQLLAADLRDLRKFFASVAGPINPEIHRQSKMPVFEEVPAEKQPRMPGAELTRKILARAGYRCRFCQVRVVIKQAFRIFARAVPLAVRTGATDQDVHFGLSVLTASMDHLVPFSRGGTNGEDNLVTACASCNYGRSMWLIDEVEILDPRGFPAPVDSWDGLSRLLAYKKS